MDKKKTFGETVTDAMIWAGRCSLLGGLIYVSAVYLKGMLIETFDFDL